MSLCPGLTQHPQSDGVYCVHGRCSISHTGDVRLKYLWYVHRETNVVNKNSLQCCKKRTSVTARLPSKLRPTTCECVLSYMWSVTWRIMVTQFDWS